MSNDGQYEMLVDSLRLAAASAKEQVEALPEFVSVTDEVGTTFGNAYLFVPQLVEVGRVSTRAAIALKRLDDFFEAMPKDGSIAPDETLRNHPFWAEARRLAAEALEALGEEKRPPNLEGVAYVPGPGG